MFLNFKSCTEKIKRCTVKNFCYIPPPLYPCSGRLLSLTIYREWILCKYDFTTVPRKLKDETPSHNAESMQLWFWSIIVKMSLLGGDTSLQSQAVYVFRLWGFASVTGTNLYLRIVLFWIYYIMIYCYFPVYQYLAFAIDFLTPLHVNHHITFPTCPSSQEFISESYRWLMLVLLSVHNFYSLQSQVAYYTIITAPFFFFSKANTYFVKCFI